MRFKSIRHLSAEASAPGWPGLALAGFALACALFSGCAEPPPPSNVEQPPAPQEPVPQAAEPQEYRKGSPPKLDEVQAAVVRVFKDAALIHTDHKPNYFAGDFNGDLSEDIAVILKPAPGKLSDMNEEFPAWMLKDARVAPDRASPNRLRVDTDEVLLAMIHGHGPDGWRDSQATQTYLLKNAVGSEMRVQPGKTFVAASKGKKLPPVHGDLIGQVLGGAPGYLYYARTTYSWYDPKSFTGAPEAGPFHGRAVASMKK